MVQTNLREIDMADIDAVVFAQELKEFGATVVNLTQQESSPATTQSWHTSPAANI